VEVLVTLVLIVIGLLGLSALQAKSTVVQVESFQRAQALILAQDMADRIGTNKAQAASYVGNDYGTGTTANCAGKTGADLDLCEWGNSIRGTSETRGATPVNVGTLMSGRGCIHAAKDASGAVVPNEYAVTVVWQGTVSTQAPAGTCGKDQYGPDAMRRAVVAIVHLAALAS
jgi:type IV pilus assembly protein PilV